MAEWYLCWKEAFLVEGGDKAPPWRGPQHHEEAPSSPRWMRSELKDCVLPLGNNAQLDAAVQVGLGAVWR